MSSHWDLDLLMADRLALRDRPAGPPVMYQRWRSLVFSHFACDPNSIQSLLPKGLTVDVYPDATGAPQAWVGLVPFRMEAVRPRFAPALPGLSWFPETNVRTYVHREGRSPGVWFFSLDAANAVACAIARRQFSLPYHHARMAVEDGRRYRSERANASVSVRCRWGVPLPTPDPGSLEFFLVERYLLYSMHRGSLFEGRVHHAPYALREVEIEFLEESLVVASGITPARFTHHVASDGVDVEVFPLRPAR